MENPPKPVTKPVPEPNGVGILRSKMCDIEKDAPNHKLFKPPKNDTNYFYFTEIQSDWVAMKK